MGGTISRYASTGFYSGILHDLASALVTYFTSINCDFKQHFRTELHVTEHVPTSIVVRALAAMPMANGLALGTSGRGAAR